MGSLPDLENLRIMCNVLLVEDLGGLFARRYLL